MSACGVCGADDRYPGNGNCKPCLKARMRVYHVTKEGKAVSKKYAGSDKGREARSRGAKKHYRENLDKHWLWRLKGRASRAGLPFDIELSDLVIPEVCPILLMPLQRGAGRPGPCSPSIDKIIPSLGYVKGNVRVISQLANTMKQNATPEQLMTFAANIGPYLNAAGVGR